MATPHGSPGASGQAISAAVARLRAGGLVAFPTETVYGLGADAFNAAAVARVFALKGRPSNNPLIVHVADVAMARRVAAVWSVEAEKLAAAFWPGPLSIIVPKRPEIPDAVSAGGPTIAVRCPDHPLTLELLRAFDGPLVGPSANPSGRVSPTTSAHVRASFSENDVLVLDGGPCRAGIESTVVAVGESDVRVLRPGLITPDQISQVLGRPVAVPVKPPASESAVSVGAARAGSFAPMESPGLLDQHYAPVRSAWLVRASQTEPFLRTHTGRHILIAPAAWLSPDAASRGLQTPEICARIELPADAHGYARGLYGALIEADRPEFDPAEILIIEPPGEAVTGPDAPVWAAILDRLGRAARKP